MTGAFIWILLLVWSSYLHSYKYEDVFKKFPDWPPGARNANGTALCK